MQRSTGKGDPSGTWLVNSMMLDVLDVRSYTVCPPIVFAVKCDATHSAIAELECPPPPPDEPAM